MNLSLAQLQGCMPYAGARAPIFLDVLNAAMAEFHIDTLLRQACFLAQVAHESGSLQYTREIASGDAYDAGPLAARLGNTPEADGDGQRFKGRGLLQITGTTNYRACGNALGRDLLADPAFLETPIGASRSAAWFWSNRGLNDLADQGSFGTICQKINGGFNGLDDRIRHYVRCRKALGI
jgi:putative chitinase